jgi:hypothetical protein
MRLRILTWDSRVAYETEAPALAVNGTYYNSDVVVTLAPPGRDTLEDYVAVTSGDAAESADGSA